MIHSAVAHIVRSLNQYMRRTLNLNEDIVVISNIVEQDGNVAANVNNKMAVFLVNVEKDVTPGHSRNHAGFDSTRSVVHHPVLHLNLFLMFSANFGGQNYPEALKFLSHTIGFFQKYRVINHHNAPDLDPGIDKLIMEIENLNIKDLSSLWSILSGKYLPSVLYRVRMLTFDSSDVKTQVSALSDPVTQVGTL
nr:DUF4255 domain-containing protein [uncultured Desulfobacter sp.]